MDGATQRLAAPIAEPTLERRRVGVRRPEWFDVVIVAALAVAYAVVLPATTTAPDDLWRAVGAAVLSTVPLLWRTPAPVLTWALVTVMQVALLLTVPVSAGAAAGITYLSPLIALGAVAARRPLWMSSIALALTCLSMATTGIGTSPDAGGWVIFVSAVASVIGWGLGVLAHHHHHRLMRLRRDHESTGAAVAAERSRIASELNGIIKDGVSVMLREAASARAAMTHDPSRAAAAFTSIEAAGVEAMHELRRLLHLLHDGSGLPTAEPGGASAGARVRWAGFSRWIGSVTGWDVAVTAAVIAATVTFAMTSLPGPTRLPASLYFALALWVLLWRRTAPVTVFLLVIGVHAGAVVVFRDGVFVWDSWTSLPPVLVALAAVAAARPRRISLPALAVAYGYLALPSFEYPDVLVPNLITLAALVAAVWVGGLLAGTRRREIAELEADASEAGRAVEQERARLAYDLHDVIGHAITVMALQAAGARRIMAHDLGRAVAALAPIEDAGAQALAQLDELVRVLSGGTTNAGRTSPRQGLADLDQLVERTRGSVASINVVMDGRPRRLEPSIDLAAYSVIREALANIVKHAARDAWVEVGISWSDELVAVSVVNSLGGEDPPPSHFSGGFGLVHVRERVRIAGGELRWSRGDDVFRVEASLPAGSLLMA